MKKITQMFPRVGTSTIMNTLDKHHISIEEPEKTTFSDVNLVTGPNGAGKTRLLNALLELYQKVQDVEILYGYFPALATVATGRKTGRRTTLGIHTSGVPKHK